MPFNKGFTCPVRYTVADAGAIPKGSLLYVADPRTAAVTSGDNQAFCGIAATQKVANDGSTTIGAWTHGIFDLKDSGAGFNAGDRVSIKAANQIAVTAAADLIFADVGIALETASAAEVVAVLIGSGF